MNIAEYKPLYQDVLAFFGVRNGVIYNGFAAADGTPIYHYGPSYQGLGTAQEKCRLSLGPALALAAMGTNYSWVEAPVMQRNTRNLYASQMMWGFDVVKGFEDKSPVKMRSTNIQTLESGELTVIPRAPGTAADIGIGSTPYAGIRYSDRIGTQMSPYTTQVAAATTSMSFRFNGNSYYDGMVADLIPLEGTSRFASLTYCSINGALSSFEPKTFKVFDASAINASLTEVGKVTMNSSNDGSRAHVGYSIPLDESLIERDQDGNATAYHLIHGKSQSGGLSVPGKLIYKKIGLRPWVEPVTETVLEDITTGTWPLLPSTNGNCVVKIEGRAFTYTHDDVKYLVVFYKMGRHTITDFTAIPFTFKRAVLFDGVAGPFETITFPTPFPDYGNALVLSPDRKTMWHYTYTGVKVVCFQFGANITMDAKEVQKDTYISAIGVDNNMMLMRTDLNTKYVIRPGAALPTVAMSFDKANYNIGDTAVLTVTTESPTPVTINIEVTGAIEKKHTKTLSVTAPVTIPLTVSGILQACMVN